MYGVVRLVVCSGPRSRVGNRGQKNGLGLADRRFLGDGGVGLLLVWSAVLGPVGTLVTKLGQVARVPGATFIGVTLLLPFLLAAFAAAVPLSLRERGQG